VIRRNHCVELAAHGADKNGVGGEWSGDAGRLRGGSKYLLVLHSEASAIAGVRIESAQGDARRLYAEPSHEILARDRGG